MSVAISATATKVKRSWADIVKGNASVSTSPEIVEEIAPEEKPSKHTLQPAARGKYQCYCLGEVLVMLGHYGWIKAFEEIDHPDAVKTGGRIYVHKRDVKCDEKLVQGDIVSFYLYADDQGFGAECCQVEERLVDEQEFMHAGDFSPESGLASSWNPFATEFVPSSNVVATVLNPEAPEFEPSAFTNNSCLVSDFMPTTPQVEMQSNPNVTAINPAFLSDDESDDASSFNDADVSDNGDKESIFDESDYSSEHDAEVESDDDFVVVHAPFIAKGSISDGSTSVGVTSESEKEDAMPFVSPPPGLELLVRSIRPPPGLSL